MVRNQYNSERRSKWNIYNIFRNRYISTISTRNNRKNSGNHRDHRYRQNHKYNRYYNVALCLLAIVGTPALAEQFPDKAPEWGQSQEEGWFMAGQVSVVRWLRSKYEDQEDDALSMEVI